jgi:hypothetical protein
MYFLCGLYASKRIENAKPLELMPGVFQKGAIIFEGINFLMLLCP